MRRAREIPGTPSRMITTSSDLAGLVDELPSNGPPFAGFDLEADNLHRYAEQLCLIQITTGESVVLVDPLEVEDLTPLKDYLAGTTVWMHGADFDMTLLRREFGCLPHMIYDTQIAARLLGILRFSYANLVDQFFDIQLCKASQKENWGQRPLPEKMCEYASNDVRYLLPLADALEAGLREKGRFDWFVESCRAAMERVLDRDEEREDPWRIRGAGKLDRQALCFLRALWEWRDHEAREWDRPPFMVVRNQQLTAWAEALVRGKRLELPRNVKGARARRLRDAIENGAPGPESRVARAAEGKRTALGQRPGKALRRTRPAARPGGRVARDRIVGDRTPGRPRADRLGSRSRRPSSELAKDPPRAVDCPARPCRGSSRVWREGAFQPRPRVARRGSFPNCGFPVQRAGWNSKWRPSLRACVRPAPGAGPRSSRRNSLPRPNPWTISIRPAPPGNALAEREGMSPPPGPDWFLRPPPFRRRASPSPGRPQARGGAENASRCGPEARQSPGVGVGRAGAAAAARSTR